jgi:hypothetical protein
MSASGGTWLRRLFPRDVTRASRPRSESVRSRKAIPGVESLERIALLSTGMATPSGAAVRLDRAGHHRVVEHVTKPHVSYRTDVSTEEASVTLPAQTVSIGSTTTNFTNQPLSPALDLFNPALGTLISVVVSHTGTVQSDITSQNLSPALPTVITGSLTGSFQLDGLNQPFAQPPETVKTQPTTAGPNETVVFPTLVSTDTGTSTFTDASSLAFFTGSSGRSAIMVTMDATAVATASAPGGSLLTSAQSSASGSVTVTYTYMPVCPTVIGVGRIGVHHERTELVVTFQGVVDPTKAAGTGNYSVLTPSDKEIAIESASFDPATNEVTLLPEERLNVHDHYKLSVVLPCSNMQMSQTVVIPFGGKNSLIWFYNHRGQFVTVQDGRISGYYSHRDQFTPVHDGKIEDIKE